MSRIWILSETNRLRYPLDCLLAARHDCEVHSPIDNQPGHVGSEPPEPDVLVIDLVSASEPANFLSQRLANLSPSTSVVAVCSDRYVASNKFLQQYPFDEVIYRPDDECHSGETAERLLEKVALLDRITIVQQRLRKEMNEGCLIAKSSPMREIVERLPRLAGISSTVLITGETGTGKELIARAIHYLGPRAGKPFITVDCGSIPELLMENELFGHVRGAYTDAAANTRGLVQEADGGTLFVDEVETLPLNVQSKILRFLQERQVKRLGHAKYSAVDVRVVAATNADLPEFVRSKRFREDLYYRLNVVPLFIPPLRERKSDIPELTSYFIKRYARTLSPGTAIPRSLMQQWIDHDWPGNVRELENRVQEWLAFPGPQGGFPPTGESIPNTIPSLAEIRKESLTKCELAYFRVLLASSRGNITAASRTAKIDRKSLRLLLRKHGLNARDFRD